MKDLMKFSLKPGFHCMVDSTNEEAVQHGEPGFTMSVHRSYIIPENGIIIYYHWHKEMECTFFTLGRAQLQIGGQSFLVQTGDCFIVPPNTPHFAKRLDETPVEFFSILVDFRFLASMENDLIQKKYLLPFFFESSQYMILIPQEQGKENRIFQLMVQVRDAYQMEELGYELMVKSKLLEMLCACYRWIAEEPESRKPAPASFTSAQIEKTLDYIQHNYRRHISLSEMAKETNMSDSGFCRFMKRAFNISFIEFLNNYRVSQAVRMVEYTDKRILEIAMETGFNSVNRFIEIFKKNFGYTPTEYRKKFSICEKINKAEETK